MFSFLRSAAGKRRAEAKDLMAQATKVLRYRSDVLPAGARAEIAAAVDALKSAVSGAAVRDESGYKTAFAGLDATLRRHGGTIYPVGAVADWVETFVIAAILAGGVRAYVFQPFKIPTNSMYPTYHGMTAAVYGDDAPEPGVVGRAVRKVTLGATHFAPVSPVAGEVYLVLKRTGYGHFADCGEVLDSGMLGLGILPGAAKRQLLMVGYTPVYVDTPADFTFSSATLGAYFPAQARLPVPEQQRWDAVFAAASAAGDVIPVAPGDPAFAGLRAKVFSAELKSGYLASAADGELVLLRTRKMVRAGEPIIRFDVLTGDMVVVDRVSYHFSRPAVGDAFVFRTREVPAMRPRDDFYIKRLVGMPGDTLEVKAGQLWRNGVVAAGNAGFDGNNGHFSDLEYFGYTASIGGANSLDAPRTLPPAQYWAMGDNSTNSQDSRAFGSVPERALVGRALFILHPFGPRWGGAR